MIIKYGPTTLRIILVMVCVAPLIVSPTTIYSFVIGKALYARVLIEIALALWLPLILLVPENRPRYSWVLVALLAWLAVSTAAAIFGVNIDRSLWSSYNRMNGVVDLAHWTIYALMIASMFQNKEHWKQLLTVNAIVVGAVASYGLTKHLVIPIINGTPSLGYFTSTLSHSFFAGSYAGLNINLVLARLSLSCGKKMATVLILIVVLGLMMLWFSSARAALLTCMMTMTVFVVMWFVLDRRRISRYISATMLSLGVIVIVLFALVITTDIKTVFDREIIIQRFDEIATGEDNGIRQRAQLISVSVQAFKTRPVIGYGPDNFGIGWAQYIDVWDHWPEVFDHAHNKFLEVAVTTGSIGLLTYGSLCGIMIWTAIRVMRREQKDKRLFVSAMGIALLGYLIMCIVMVDALTFSLYFALLAGYLISEEFSQQKQTISVKRPPVIKKQTMIIASMIIVPLLLYSLLQYNARIFLSSAPISGINIVSTINNERAIARHFPPMANSRRYQLLPHTVRFNSQHLSDEHTDIEVPIIMEYIKDGLDTDPENWAWPYLATVLYQNASDYDLRYALEARPYLRTLISISPSSHYTVDVYLNQLALDKKLKQNHQDE